MHELLDITIRTPEKVKSFLAGNKSAIAKQLIALARCNSADMFLTIANSYLHHTVGTAIADTPILDRRLVADFGSVDDLYYKVAEVYKAVTGKLPPLRQEYTISGTKLAIKNDGTKPLLIVVKPVVEDGQLVIDPDNMSVVVYFL